MKKVIYILGLDHSGSTILDIILSKHPETVGLGETYAVLREKERAFEDTHNFCSCGSDLEKCPLWKEYLVWQKENKGKSYENKYKNLLKIVSEKIGKDVVIDSSKNDWMLEVIKKLSDAGEVDLKVIFLLRDARGWAASRYDLGVKAGRKIRFYPKYFYNWYKMNRKLKKLLEKDNYDYIQVSYEELAFNTEEKIRDIFEFTGLDPDIFNIDFPPNTHIAYGNRTKKDAHKKKAILYDSRWFHRFWLNFFFVLMPHIFFWNKKNVALEKKKWRS